MSCQIVIPHLVKSMDNHSSWVRRPKAGEDDSDVIRQDDEFTASKHNPAAKCVRISRKTEHAVNERPINGFDATKSSNSRDRIPVLHDIVERDVVYLPSCMKRDNTPKGFPVPSRRPKGIDLKKKTSIFLQHMEILAEKESVSTASASTDCCERIAETCQSVIIDGSGLNSANAQAEAKRLHEENVKKISSLSSDEIMQLRKELFSSLGSDKVEFLRSKRKNCCDNKSVADGSKVLPVLTNHSSSVSMGRKPENLSGDPFEETLKDSGGFARDAVILENMPEVNPSECQSAEVVSETDVPSDELPIPPEEAGRWLNMNKVEKDKLAWMTLLPKLQSVDANTSHTARFDFEGNLLPHDLDVPTQMGLHHHSNEPEVAGYSVEELFLLARSSFQSQRIAALETLAHILENHWNGRFDSCFGVSLLSSLLEAGLAPLLRWALDDNTVSSVAAAVLCIHHLLICKSDELCLDWTYCYLLGHVSPFLAAKVAEPNSNLEGLTDASIIKMDVITGFLRMDILPRFRYILRVLCPTSSVCKLIIEICIRIARHSSDAAAQVAKLPGLLEAVFIKFLPISWSYTPHKGNSLSSYFPMFSAVKLVRVIASASKELALHMLENYDVKGFLICYLTIDPSDKKLPPVEIQKLMVESLKLWHTLLSYNLCTDIYLDLHPLLLRQFTFCQSVSINTNLESNTANYEYAAHFLKVLESVVIAAADFSEDSSVSSEDSRALRLPDVAEVAKMCELCLERWLYEFSVGPTSCKGQILLACCLNLMSSFCNKSFAKHEDASSLIANIFKNILTSHLPRCLISKEFVALLSNLNSSSLLLCKGIPGTKRDSPVLPSLGSVLWKDDIIPLLKEGSPFPLLTAVANFLAVLPDFNNCFAEAVAEVFPRLCIQEYFHSVADLAVPFHHWFARFEIQLVFNLLNLFKLTHISSNVNQQSSISKESMYRTALILAPCISTPYERLLQKAFEEVIFHPSFLWGVNCTDSDPNLNDQLKQICTFYVNFFMSASLLKKSRCLLDRCSGALTSYSFQQREVIVPDASWPFSPILNYYKESKCRQASENAPAGLVPNVSYCLQWVHLTCSRSCFSALSDIPESVTFSHLCLVFLIDPDLFKDENVSHLLSLILQRVLAQNPKPDLVGMHWIPLPSYEEIFSELLAQFEASSFGDQLYGNFLLVPMQQCYPASWKLMLFSDHEQILFFLNVPLNKLAVPLQNYLYPIETEPKLLKKYFQALSSGKLNHHRSPLLFLMAVHHLHHFIHNEEEQNANFRHILRKSLDRIKDKDVYQYITYYGELNLDSELGFSFETANE